MAPFFYHSSRQWSLPMDKVGRGRCLSSLPSFDQIRLADGADDFELLEELVEGYQVQRRTLPIRPGLSIDVLTAADQALVRADAMARDIDPFGSTVWPSSLAAAIEICDVANVLRDGSLDGLTVLELGAGTGVASYTAAALGATVIATDVAPLSLALLDAGARMQVSNKHSSAEECCDRTPFRGSLESRLFDVCNESLDLPPCDILVSADMLYNPVLTAAVARRCIEAVEVHGAGLLVTSPPGRSGEQRFLRLLEGSGVVTLGGGNAAGGASFSWNDAILPVWADALWAAGSADSMTQVIRSLPPRLNKGLEDEDAASICYNGRWPTLKKRSGRTRAAAALAALQDSRARWAANDNIDRGKEGGL